jgi:hypothetical protein
MLIYRLVSWIFISAIGWVVFFFVFRTEKDIDPDADPGEPSGDEPAEFSPDPEAIYAPEAPEAEQVGTDLDAKREPEPEP